jgi:hypothetical protein
MKRLLAIFDPADQESLENSVNLGKLDNPGGGNHGKPSGFSTTEYSDHTEKENRSSLVLMPWSSFRVFRVFGVFRGYVLRSGA